MPDTPFQPANTPEIQQAYKSSEEWREEGFVVIPGQRAEYFAVRDIEGDPHVRVALFHGNQIMRLHDHWNWQVFDRETADAARTPAAKGRKTAAAKTPDDLDDYRQPAI